MTELSTKGVTFDKQYNKFHARVYRKGKRYHVGRFQTQEEAITARQQFIKRYLA
jgi:hypothetical protein